MKVFDLICDADHRFEGWFASAEQYASQRDAQAVRCPLCESSAVRREPSAPRLHLGIEESKPTAAAAPAPSSDDAAALTATVFERLRRVISGTEDVGIRFAEEARRIHYAETPPRAIRGTATDQEQRELDDEGIETIRLPIPRALTETLQ